MIPTRSPSAADRLTPSRACSDRIGLFRWRNIAFRRYSFADSRVALRSRKVRPMLSSSIFAIGVRPRGGGLKNAARLQLEDELLLEPRQGAAPEGERPER